MYSGSNDFLNGTYSWGRIYFGYISQIWQKSTSGEIEMKVSRFLISCVFYPMCEFQVAIYSKLKVANV